MLHYNATRQARARTQASGDPSFQQCIGIYRVAYVKFHSEFYLSIPKASPGPVSLHPAIHGGSAIHGPKEPFLAIVWAYFEGSVRATIGSISALFFHSHGYMSEVHVCQYFDAF